MEHLQNNCKANALSIFLHPVSETEVQNVLKSLKNSQATDLYNHSVGMYKENLMYLSAPLTHIINLIIQTGIFPNKLKRAKIIPLLKSGDIEDVSNYRPIALLPILSKIFDKILALRIVNYFESINIFTGQAVWIQEGQKHIKGCTGACELY